MKNLSNKSYQKQQISAYKLDELVLIVKTVKGKKLKPKQCRLGCFKSSFIEFFTIFDVWLPAIEINMNKKHRYY